MRMIEEIKKDIGQAQRAGDIDAMVRYADELEEIGTPLAQGVAQRTRGQAYRLQGKYDHAFARFREALEHFEKAGASGEVAHTMVAIGFAYDLKGDFAKALETLTRALALCEQAGNRHDIAAALENLARVYLSTGDYPKGIEYFSRAQEMHLELGDREGVANAIAGIGVAYYYLSDFPRALENFRQALELHESMGNRTNIAKITGNIGNVYWSSMDMPQALEYYRRALAIHEEQGNRGGVAHLNARIGSIHEDEGNNELALEHFERSLEIFREIDDHVGICREMGDVATSLLRQQRFDEAAKILDDQAKLSLVEPAVLAQYHENRAMISQHRGALDDEYQHLTLALTITQQASLRSHEATYHLSLRDLAARRRDIDSYILHNDEYTRIEREISGIESMRKMAMIEAQKKIDAERMEKERHLTLLYNTLPPAVADRVLKGERVNDKHERVVVLFIDLAGFTRITSVVEPDDVVALLEKIFTICDDVVAQYGLTKIKTIGDAYMAVCFPSEGDIEERSATAALHILRDLSDVHGPDGNPVTVRVGAHVGPVIAGIIGTSRMQYDVWGDTVNVASRMESSGEPGRIHVSEAFATALFSVDGGLWTVDSTNDSRTNDSMTLHKRGVVDIKGKGPMTTYWLEGTT